MSRFIAGQVVRFTYRHAAVDQHTGDKFKEVFVLNPEWQGKMHGIDLKRLTTAEREVLAAIMDPNTVRGRHRLPLVNDILRRMNPIERIKNPLSFYNRFVKSFLRRTDAYRKYWSRNILNPSIVREPIVKVKTFNPKPLFKKSEVKPAEIAKDKAGRLDMLKNRHKQVQLQKKGVDLMKDVPASEVPSPDKRVNRKDLLRAAAARKAAKGKADVASPDSKVNRIAMLKAANDRQKAQARAEKVYDDDHVEKREKDDQYSNKKPKNAEYMKQQRDREAMQIQRWLAKKGKDD